MPSRKIWLTSVKFNFPMSDFNVLGILPARGGSKGLPGKNLRKLCGRPLLAWAADAIALAPSVSRAVCSTDDNAIGEAAQANGLEIPFHRPAELATDTALVTDVILHAINTLDETSKPFTHVVLVQATSPTVTVADVESAIKLVRDGGADTVISGFRAGMYHPAIMYTLNNDNQVSWLYGDQQEARRQEFPAVFIRTGLVYVVSVKILRERGSLYGDQIRSLMIDEGRAITIDEERDFDLAQRLMMSMGNA